jgi:hypothetical protein
MTTSATATAKARKVRVTDRALTVELQDGRVVSVPVTWYPRLAEASRRERGAWVLIGPGAGIHWPALDEDISVDGLLRGLPSGESAASLRRWRASRRRRSHRAPRPTSGARRRRRIPSAASTVGS